MCMIMEARGADFNWFFAQISGLLRPPRPGGVSFRRAATIEWSIRFKIAVREAGGLSRSLPPRQCPIAFFRNAGKMPRIQARPAAHAGAAYPAEPRRLRAAFAACFAQVAGQRAQISARSGEVRGLLSPHIDPGRGVRGYASAYGRLAERCRATTFIIFGTAHGGLRQWFAATERDFATPLGIVRTDRRFLARVATHLRSSLFGRRVDLFADEEAHRWEHSIEFQAVFLRYALGARRSLRIAPILVSSFAPLIDAGRTPDDVPEIQCFLAALRAAESEQAGRVCYVSGADLAHVGRRFGDSDLLTPRRLSALERDDRKLLDQVCRCSAAGWFRHVARSGDRNRICGLAPTYMLLEAVQPAVGKLLHYEQAVDGGGAACVSFASVALTRRKE